MQGEFDRARQSILSAQAAFRDLGLLVEAAVHAQALIFLETRAGNLLAAERFGRAGVEELERLGDRAYYGTTALMLADVLTRAGKYADAETWHARARATTSDKDVATIAGLDAAEGLLRARRGERDEAERLARRGVELVQTMDFNDVLGTTYMLASRALAAAGNFDEAVARAQAAVAVYGAKGDVAGADIARALAAELPAA
jgi:tetratricopeptide (TPR) repeat protein